MLVTFITSLLVGAVAVLALNAVVTVISRKAK